MTDTKLCKDCVYSIAPAPDAPPFDPYAIPTTDAEWASVWRCTHPNNDVVDIITGERHRLVEKCETARRVQLIPEMIHPRPVCGPDAVWFTRRM